MKTDVTPIVAKADAEALDGLKALAKSIQGEWTAQRKAQDAADAHGLEMGRQICAFAASKEVQGKVAVINAKKNGRPQAAHCFVAEQLVLSGQITGISQRHLERCARAFLKAQKKGLPLNTPIRVAEASDLVKKASDKPLDEMQPSPERLFDTDASQGNDGDRESFDPERDAFRVARKIKEFLYTPEGHPRLRSNKQKIEFATSVNKALDELGIDWELVPEERK